MSRTPKPGTGITNKRRRELAAAKYERQSARRTERAARRRRNERIAWTLVALFAVVGLAAVLVWKGSTGSDTASPATASPSTADIGCDPAPTPTGSPQSWDSAPEQALAKKTDYTLTLTTNCGDIVIDTLPKEAPETVNSMLWLAEQGYFDNTLCHRVTTDGLYVLQCGDPTASGTGGPGFTLPDENLPAASGVNYPAGTVAMANAGENTAGSQFFIVYQDTTLPANYTIWGDVTEGLDIVSNVAAAGTTTGGTDGSPAAQIGILGTTVDPGLG